VCAVVFEAVLHLTVSNYTCPSDSGF
jgi:hypothetical protein